MQQSQVFGSLVQRENTELAPPRQQFDSVEIHHSRSGSSVGERGFYTADVGGSIPSPSTLPNAIGEQPVLQIGVQGSSPCGNTIVAPASFNAQDAFLLRKSSPLDSERGYQSLRSGYVEYIFLVRSSPQPVPTRRDFDPEAFTPVSYGHV